MDDRRIALSLLFLAVLVSGCTHTGGSTGSESARAITINSFSVTPSEIYEDTSVRVSIDATNTGNLPAEIYLGSGGRGQRVLKNYCPDIFTIESRDDFSVTTSGDRDGNAVALEPGEQLKLRWRLKQEGNVPLYGFKCSMEAQMAFNYSVRSYRQVQVKKTRAVQGSPNLYAESSSGPMLFAIGTRGSTDEHGGTFVATESGESREMIILLQLQNQRREGYNKGIVDVYEESLAIKATPPLELDEGFDTIDESTEEETRPPGFRPGGEVRGGGATIRSGYRPGSSFTRFVARTATSNWGVNSGDYSDPKCDVQAGEEIQMFEGQSQFISCSVELPSRENMESPSRISEVFAKVNYTYLKDVGSRTVEVKPRGN